MSETKATTYYHRAAIAGRPFGIYLCLIFISMVLSRYSLMASLAFLLLVLAFPFLLFRSMRKSHRLRDYDSTVGEQSMEGLLTVFYGCVICGLVTMAYLTWIEPDYIITLVRDSIAMLRSTGTAGNAHAADILNRMIATSSVPSASDFTLSMAWLTMAVGGILSLIFAPIIHIAKPRRDKNDFQQTRAGNPVTND